MTHATLTVMLAAGGAWLAENAWRQWGREATESRLLAGQKAAHADYRVTIEYRQETADLARVFSATLKADGFNTEIAETPLALPAEAGASLPADNRIQWGGSPDDPIVEHIGERLRYFAWGRAPKVTNQSDPPAESAQPSDTKALRVLLWTPGLTGGGFTDPLAYTLTPEQIAKLVTPSDIDTGDARQLQMQISRLNEQLVNRLVPVDNSLIFINFMNRLRAKRTDSLTNRFFLLSIRPV